MKSQTIEWTRLTWSPWEGCQNAGPGCDHCYAEAMNKWLRKGENWGPGAPRRVYSDKHWDKLRLWNEAARKAGTTFTVFPSVCDPFDNAAPMGERLRFWSAIAKYPHLHWLLLTKRIGNARAMLPAEWFLPGRWPKNVRIGATVVNQKEADRDIVKLLDLWCPNFLSIEPMLGPVCLTELQAPGELRVWIDALRGEAASMGGTGPLRRVRRIDWVISGGESGRQARPSHPDWHRSLRDQCAAAGVPYMFKQWGTWAEGIDVDILNAGNKNGLMRGGKFICITPAGDAPTHGERAHMCEKRTKKAAGRLLDGVEHNGFPS